MFNKPCVHFDDINTSKRYLMLTLRSAISIEQDPILHALLTYQRLFIQGESIFKPTLRVNAARTLRKATFLRPSFTARELS